MPFWSQPERGSAIGVFDSGHGGLTILRGLVDRLPRQRFIYLGDHAHAPYGSRPAKEIVDLTRMNATRLFDLGCRLVILACNTAAAVALRELQRDWLPQAYPNHRLLGVLVPMVEAIARTSWYSDVPDRSVIEDGSAGETVAVFATTATVAAGSYVTEVKKRAARTRVIQRACPELAGLIEQDAGDAAIAPIVESHVAALLGTAGSVPEKAVLGCTHYPLIQHLFRAALPAQTEILSQPRRVAESLTAYLWRHPDYRQFEMEPPAPLCFTSGDPNRVSMLASRFFGGHLRFQSLPSI
ncbi:aspartate/glutamate racemase family protein [Dongia soli]|uniref:Glutamate racemase n=1 Tax=Dongia soli TaxID=600628 RepID=A0ABU5E6T4_9PROT|nr:aspartate/glutamate racemase family protein [Dongia soli]MDY0881986.1 aspartate/glutamate racemase family protein [Dongia soli]